MTLTAVRSSNVKAVGYDAAARAVTVLFLNGSAYRYAGVGADHHALLAQAPSPGRWVREFLVRNPAVTATKLTLEETATLTVTEET